MTSFLKQSVGLIGARIAAACCLETPAVRAALGTLGLGFTVHDAYLFPLFVGYAGLSLSLLYRSARQLGRMTPFRLSPHFRRTEFSSHCPMMTVRYTD